MNKSPIFIHSLFRAASTYLFNVFRRSPAGYCCFQEPLHELAVFARDNPTVLADHNAEKARSLRHPIMDDSYFKELLDAWPKWTAALQPFAVYDGYFCPPGSDIGLAYWQALIDSSTGRPVFQETRTSGRIRAIRDALGGYHLYLWRNPWDQWWSHKIAPYFDAANQLILNAPNAPPALLALRTLIRFEPYSGDDLAQSFNHFLAAPLGSAESYLLFYTLWCLALQEGRLNAGLLINIDRLTDSPAYRAATLNDLAQMGIGALDFSDCKIPQGHYDDSDRRFFSDQEERVHGLLLEGAWSQADLDRVSALRADYEPSCWRDKVSAAVSLIVEQASRARAVARHLEDRVADAARELLVHNGENVRLHGREDQQQRLEEIKDAFAQVRVGLAAHNAENERLHARLAARDGEFTRLQAHITSQLCQTDGLTSEIARLQAHTAWQQGEKEAATAKLAQARAALTARDVAIEQLQTHTAWQQREKEAATAELAQARAALTARDMEIERLHAHIAWQHGNLEQVHQQLRDCHAQLLALNHSTSGEVTRPLRAVKRLTSRDLSPFRLSAADLILTGKEALRPLLAAGIRQVLIRPQLRAGLSPVIKRVPGLHQRLLRVALNTSVLLSEAPDTVNHSVPDIQCGHIVDEEIQGTMTPHARHIYANLRAAIDKIDEVQR